MTGIMQSFVGGSYGYPNGWPVANIGDAYGGGFFAGQINVSGTKYNLVVAPKSTGEATRQWGPATHTGVSSVIAGPTNTSSLVALGTDFQAAIFCNNLNSGGGLNGYTDWYMPAINELEVLYYFLKPNTTVNYGFGANPNAVPPEPVNTPHTSTNPTVTTATGTNGFRTGESQAFTAATYYWSSTEGTGGGGTAPWTIYFDGCYEETYWQQTMVWSVRAVRRIPV